MNLLCFMNASFKTKASAELCVCCGTRWECVPNRHESEPFALGTLGTCPHHKLTPMGSSQQCSEFTLTHHPSYKACRPLWRLVRCLKDDRVALSQIEHGCCSFTRSYTVSLAASNVIVRGSNTFNWSIKTNKMNGGFILYVTQRVRKPTFIICICKVQGIKEPIA